MAMKLVKIVATSSQGSSKTIEATTRGSLVIERDSPGAAFVDIRDDGMLRHADSRHRLVAQIPASWAIELFWSAGNVT